MSKLENYLDKEICEVMEEGGDKVLFKGIIIGTCTVSYVGAPSTRIVVKDVSGRLHRESIDNIRMVY